MKPAAPPALVCALLALGRVGPAGAARAQTVVYVNAGLATGANTGASWADACRGADALQRGLDAAAPIAGAGQTVQLWVAAGTYVPTMQTLPPNPLSATFRVRSHEEVYGGFVGTEVTLGERDPGANVTTLSGLLSATQRVWHILTASAGNGSFLLDGMTISGGDARDPSSGTGWNGAGLYSLGGNPLVRRCRFTANSAIWGGAGAFCEGGGSRFEDCAFDHNLSQGDPGGGGVYGDAIVLLRCSFKANISLGAQGYGGAVSGNAAISSCSFTGNSAEWGSAVQGSVTCTASTFDHNGWGPAVTGSGLVTDCTFTGNRADDGPAAVYGNPLELVRCTFLNNAGVGVASRFTDCVFEQNGKNYSSVVSAGTFTRCRFAGNWLNTYAFVWVGTAATDCVFIGVQGPVVLYDHAALTNCTFLNGGNPDGAVRAYGPGTTASLTNCILWGTSGSGDQSSQVNAYGGQLLLSYCDVQGLDGSLGGVGNFSADPHLDLDGRLLSPSPCIDSGDSAAVPPGVITDGFGQRRFVDDPGMPNTGPGAPGLGPVDIGAFEFQGTTCYANCDGSTGAPVLNAADFTCFLDAFGSGSPYANCDASTAAPRLNVLDFTCFLRRFASGCP